MLLSIRNILNQEQIGECGAALAAAAWVDGRRTAGYQAARVKHNAQLTDDDPVGQRLGDMILSRLERTPLFMSASLPLKVFPPMFNRYSRGQAFGTHVDTAIRQVSGTPLRVRSDLAATLFLNPPEAYDGGELVVEDNFGAHSVKLPAGDLVLYPASSLHHVRPVTRGERLAAVFWIQSMVRGDADRGMLYDLDTAIQHLAVALPEHPAVVQLTGVYHNLLRRWAGYWRSGSGRGANPRRRTNASRPLFCIATAGRSSGRHRSDTSLKNPPSFPAHAKRPVRTPAFSLPNGPRGLAGVRQGAVVVGGQRSMTSGRLHVSRARLNLARPGVDGLRRGLMLP
jgi:PKHD-type hydroxylase